VVARLLLTGCAVLCPVLLSWFADISGTVPDLSGLTELRQLDLEFNFFNGSLKGEQFCPVGNNKLNALMLRANNFTGSLDLRTCQNLTVLDMQVCGSVGGGSCRRCLHANLDTGGR
jgi:hypothetical protein